MASKECIAMLLAGGQGSRLMALTSKIAKPAVSFGGKFRIIDFSLSNCANSGIDTVGVLTQYRPYQLHEYIGSGRAWDLAEHGSGVSILPPYATQDGGAWYAGTADAITQNLNYIKNHDPKYVLILSGDHLYRMDYRKMLEIHSVTDRYDRLRRGADVHGNRQDYLVGQSQLLDRLGVCRGFISRICMSTGMYAATERIHHFFHLSVILRKKNRHDRLPLLQN